MSKTPWEAKHYPEGSIVQPVGSTISILRVHADTHTPHLLKADADLIVAAVNSYEAVKDALFTMRQLKKAHEEKGFFQAALAYGGAIDLLDVALTDPTAALAAADDER